MTNTKSARYTESMTMQRGLIIRDGRGRISGVRDLTDRQAAFVREYVRNGGDGTRAAIAAGYSAERAHSAAWEALHSARVLAAVHDEQARTIKGELANLALQTVRDLLEAEDTPKGVKADLAIKVLDRAGHVPIKDSDDDDESSKSLESMSIAELEAFIREKETVLTDVTPVPDASAALEV